MPYCLSYLHANFITQKLWLGDKHRRTVQDVDKIMTSVSDIILCTIQ